MDINQVTAIVEVVDRSKPNDADCACGTHSRATGTVAHHQFTAVATGN